MSSNNILHPHVAALSFSFLMVFIGCTEVSRAENHEESSALLFSFSAEKARFRATKEPNVYTLVLRGTDKRTVWFADRPVRAAGTLPTESLIKGWDGNGFVDEPPNGALVVHKPNGPGAIDTVVFVMGQPQLNGTTLTIPVSVLDSESAKSIEGGLANHGDRHDLISGSTALGAVSMFIDSAKHPIINGCPIGSYASCQNTNFSGFNLSYDNLVGANFSGSNFMNAILYYANLSGANLSGAQLTSANLPNANLSGANLSKSKIFSSDLSNANLSGANLKGAEISSSNFSGAITDKTTICADSSFGPCVWN